MSTYDVIVVGARCGGATVAAMCARAGLRVLLMDRAKFPSRTLSTHTMHADSLAILDNLGVLPEVEALGAPQVTHVLCDYGDFQIAGRLPSFRGIDHGLCVPRLQLDQLLVCNAAHCGSDVQEQMTVTGLLHEGGRVSGVRAHVRGKELLIRGRLVVGADGRTSTVARQVRSTKTTSQVSGWALWFGYYAGVQRQPNAAYELYFHGRSMFYIFPTTGSLHIVGGEFNTEDYPSLRVNDAPALLRSLRLCAALAPRLEEARLVDGLYGLYSIESFMRQCAGPGFALVGDASFFKDPCTGQGMYDAFRGAQILADLLVRGWAEGDPAMSLTDYIRQRDAEFSEMFQFTCRAARSMPISPDRRHVLRRISEDPHLTALYLGIHNHAVRPSEVFSKERLQSLLAPA